MFQNRTEQELKFQLDQFIEAFNQSNGTHIGYEEIRGASIAMLQEKVNEVIGNRMNDFSIPELIKIITLSQRSVQEEQNRAEEAKKKPQKPEKKHLQ